MSAFNQKQFVLLASTASLAVILNGCRPSDGDQTCQSNTDCGSNAYSCIGHRCQLNRCNVDSDCLHENDFCTAGKFCAESCYDDAGCNAGSVCVGNPGACIATCDSDSDCDTDGGYKCELDIRGGICLLDLTDPVAPILCTGENQMLSDEGQCVCKPNYKFDEDGDCVEDCPVHYKLNDDGLCEPYCTDLRPGPECTGENQVVNEQGKCVCETNYKFDENDECVEDCPLHYKLNDEGVCEPYCDPTTETHNAEN